MLCCERAGDRLCEACRLSSGRCRNRERNRGDRFGRSRGSFALGSGRRRGCGFLGRCRRPLCELLTFEGHLGEERKVWNEKKGGEGLTVNSSRKPSLKTMTSIGPNPSLIVSNLTWIIFLQTSNEINNIAVIVVKTISSSIQTDNKCTAVKRSVGVCDCSDLFGNWTVVFWGDREALWRVVCPGLNRVVLRSPWGVDGGIAGDAGTHVDGGEIHL